MRKNAVMENVLRKYGFVMVKMIVAIILMNNHVQPLNLVRCVSPMNSCVETEINVYSRAFYVIKNSIVSITVMK